MVTKINSTMQTYPDIGYVTLAHAWFEWGGLTYHTSRYFAEEDARLAALGYIENIVLYGVDKT
jgi:hypothetical protein